VKDLYAATPFSLARPVGDAGGRPALGIDQDQLAGHPRPASEDQQTCL